MYNKDDYNYMAAIRKNAFVKIANKLGKEHPITKMMGSLAWGRHNAEQGVEGNLHTAIREMAYLDGFYDCLNLWMRDNDRGTQHLIRDMYPRNYEKRPY